MSPLGARRTHRTRRAKAGPEAKATGCRGGRRHLRPSQGLHPGLQVPQGSSSLPSFSQPPCLSSGHMVPPTHVCLWV